MIGGLKFVYEPPVLRFFMGGFEPTSDWPEKLMIKFPQSDFLEKAFSDKYSLLAGVGDSG